MKNVIMSVQQILAIPHIRKEEWVIHHLFELRNSPSIVDQLAQFGAMMRFCRADEVINRFQFAYQLNDFVSDKLMKFTNCDEIERIACRQADIQIDAIKIVSIDKDIALVMALNRDVLESTRVALRKVQPDQGLDELLKLLDAEAEKRLQKLQNALIDEEDERLRAVFWMEPDAWWGKVLK